MLPFSGHHTKYLCVRWRCTLFGSSSHVHLSNKSAGSARCGMFPHLQRKASLGNSWWYPRVSAAFWMPLKRVCCINRQKWTHTSSYGVSTWTSKWVNVSISVSDPGWPPGSWNLMQFLVKHSGAEQSSGQGGSLRGVEFCEDWSSATKKQNIPCVPRWAKKCYQGTENTMWYQLTWKVNGKWNHTRCSVLVNLLKWNREFLSRIPQNECCTFVSFWFVGHYNIPRPGTWKCT